jgi:hypothetical protein
LFRPILELSRRHQRKNKSSWPPTFGAKSWRPNIICLPLANEGASKLWA